MIAGQYTFQQRKQALNESMAECVAVLRGLTANCQFGLLNDELIRDQMVESTLNPRLRERFLRDSNLTLDIVLS